MSWNTVFEMVLIYSPDTMKKVDGDLGALIGGKGMSLFKLYNAGMPVALPICIGTGGYELFVEQNHLREKINLELHRKDIKEMRWEEIWDISLRIQNFFLGGIFPEALYRELKKRFGEQFGDRPLAVRSSAPEEDSHSRSFAGLHDSYLNVAGIDELVKKIKKVWASLWSDRAILYRQELGLEVASSKMAVVLQEFVEGQTSGVLFTKNPLDTSQMVIEAVYGLNQGLVDGLIEPDRWILDRKDRNVATCSAPENRDSQFVRSHQAGVQRQNIADDLQSTPPLELAQVREIAALGMELENFFGVSQDVEWTLKGNKVHILQSRPVTTEEGGDDSTDKRSWYLSLNRSYDNLLLLWESISKKLLPEMDRESIELTNRDLGQLSDRELADELRRRSAANDRWVSIYWSDFIPFAHGVRLFGELYNDVIEPADPFEFVSLLTGQNMLSTDRNTILYECATIVRDNESMRRCLEDNYPEKIKNETFQKKLSLLKDSFSMAGMAAGEEKVTNEIISTVILRYADLDTFPEGQPLRDSSELEALFVSKGKEQLPVDPEELLDMARASYRIRDDDNIHIGRIAQELERATAHARERLRARAIAVTDETPVEDVSFMLEGGKPTVSNLSSAVTTRIAPAQKSVQARQLLGQPASRGLAKGRARVIVSATELKDFKKGEILVIDSIDPTMTFFAPLARGIIERRGGMLIHGAIIAREYGIPCITGVVDATAFIHTGDLVTVDAYLGICTVQRGL